MQTIDERIKDIKTTFLQVRGVMVALMLVTATFTGGSVLALFSPSGITWVLAIVAAFVMICLAEGMFVYQSSLFSRSGNLIQLVAAGLGTVLALATITLTDISAAVFLAHDSGYISLYSEVPEWAQMIVTFSLPVMAVVHGVILAIYDSADDIQRAERQASKDIRSAEVELKKAYLDSKARALRGYTSRAEDAGGELAGALFSDIMGKMGSGADPDPAGDDPGNFTNR